MSDEEARAAARAVPDAVLWLVLCDALPAIFRHARVLGALIDPAAGLRDHLARRYPNDPPAAREVILARLLGLVRGGAGRGQG